MSPREARIAAGLSQEALAKRLGVSQRTVSTWETGRVALTVRRAKRVADILGVPMDQVDWPESHSRTRVGHRVASGE